MRSLLAIPLLLCASLCLGSQEIWAGQSSKDSRAELRSVDLRFVGAWVRQTSDPEASQKIILILRSDGTYRKTLDALVRGVPYGGTHEGTWTMSGTVVQLSGNRTWPPYSHDLSKFQRLELRR